MPKRMILESFSAPPPPPPLPRPRPSSVLCVRTCGSGGGGVDWGKLQQQLGWALCWCWWQTFRARCCSSLLGERMAWEIFRSGSAKLSRLCTTSQSYFDSDSVRFKRFFPITCKNMNYNCPVLRLLQLVTTRSRSRSPCPVAVNVVAVQCLSSFIYPPLLSSSSP